jgi:hypothetical protein
VPQKQKPDQDSEFVCLLGLGLDNQDGHHRITSGDDFLLLGGSDETHERMVDTAIHLNEELVRRGKTLHSASQDEVIEIMLDRLGR